MPLRAPKGIIIPEEFVPLNYDMNLEEEDVIWGSQLESGQVVLIEDITGRESPARYLMHEPSEAAMCEDYSCIRAKETARWCMVTDIRREGPIVKFIGLYADGTKRSRTYNESWTWLVKTR